MYYRIILICLFAAFCKPAFSQIEKVFIERYYVTDAFDSTNTTGGPIDTGVATYRIYVDLAPGSKLLKLYGDVNHPLTISSTEVFYNNSEGQTFAKDFLKSRYSENTIALDSWVTLGQTTKKQGSKAYFGLPKNQDTDGSFIGGTNNDGGSEMLATGLLINDDATIGRPLTEADGMDTIMAIPEEWSDLGFKDLVTGNDSTIFGALVPGTTFSCTTCWLQNSGTVGVTDSNQVLLAQLTTAGDLSFELNLEVEMLIDSVPTIVKYVGTKETLAAGEVFSPFLKYPFTCGCTDPDYLEYSPEFACMEPQSCINQIRFGCTDTMACNYDSTANFSTPSSCCYPGSCSNRDIAEVCPQLMGDAFTIELYPNPANDLLNLHIVTGQQQSFTYGIYTSYGIMVYEGTTTQQTLNFVEALDINTLQPGLYHLKVTTGEQLKSQLFIIQ